MRANGKRLSERYKPNVKQSVDLTLGIQCRIQIFIYVIAFFWLDGSYGGMVMGTVTRNNSSWDSNKYFEKYYLESN
jgi:cytochrome b subunit of formate dehydrogenase